MQKKIDIFFIKTQQNYICIIFQSWQSDALLLQTASAHLDTIIIYYNMNYNNNQDCNETPNLYAWSTPSSCIIMQSMFHKMEII